MLLTNRPPFLLWANDGRSWQDFKATRKPLYAGGTFEIHVGVQLQVGEHEVLGHPTIFHELHYSLQLTIASQTKYSIDLTRRPTIV